MPRVFISYRKSDSAGITGRLADALRLRLAAGDDLFWDERSLEGGAEWPLELRESVHRADVLLAVIGPGWLSAKDDSHRRRIDQEGDWVRTEIALALKLGKQVVPVLVSEGKMPDKAAGLPNDIAKLVELQAVKLASGGAFDRDLEALAALIGLAPARQAAATLADRVVTSNLVGEILVNAYVACRDEFVAFRNAVAARRPAFNRFRLELAKWLRAHTAANFEIEHAAGLRKLLDGENHAERMIRVAALLTAASQVFRAGIPKQTVLMKADAALGGEQFWVSTIPGDSLWNVFDQPRTQDEISDTLAGFHPGLAITPRSLQGGLSIEVERIESRLWKRLEHRRMAIAVAPLTPHEVIQRNTAAGFLVDGAAAEDEQAAHLRALLRQCHHNGIVILVLPELRISPALDELIRDFLESQEITPERGILLTVAGSWHVADAAGHVNRAIVLGHRGQPVWHQDKLAEFHLRDGRAEDIQVASRQTAVDSPHGRLAVAICAGFFHERAQTVLKRTGGNVFLVPAMSPSCRDMERFAGDLVRYRAGTFVANCAIVGAEAPSFYQVPITNAKVCRITKGEALLAWRFSDNLENGRDDEQ